MPPRPAFVYVCLVASLFLVQNEIIAAPTITSFLVSRPAQARIGEPVIIAATDLASPVRVFFSNGTDPNVEAIPVSVDMARGLIMTRVPVGAATGTMKISANGADSDPYYFRVQSGTFLPGADEVSGTVTDGVSGVSGVFLVLLRGVMCGGTTFQDFAVTDPNGAYTMHGLDGNYIIFAFAPIGANLANTSAGVSLSSTPAGLDIVLAGGTAVTGHIVAGGTTTGVGNVRVSIDFGGATPGHEEVLSDPNGAFTANLPPGPHDFTFEPPEGVVLASSRQLLPIAGPTQILGDIGLATGVSITGSLTNAADGSPLPSARIFAYDPNTCCQAADDKTVAGDGSFRLVVPANSTYGMSSEMDERSPVIDVQIASVPVGSGDVVHDIAAPAAALITGTITLQGSGEPLECVGVQAQGQPPNFFYGFGRSGPGGVYTLRVAPDPNGYIITTRETDNGGSGFASKTYDGTPGGTYFFCDGTPVPAPTAGLATGPFDFVLEPEAIIEGTVSDDANQCNNDLGPSVFVVVDDGVTHACGMGQSDFNFQGPGYRVRLLPASQNLRACAYPPFGPFNPQCWNMQTPPAYDPIMTTAGGTTSGIDFCLESCLQQAWYSDNDMDGFGDPADSVFACDPPNGYTSDGTDCDDADQSVHPGATEQCDDKDNDCDGFVDGFPTTCGLGPCAGIGECIAGLDSCVIGPTSPEVCDNVDNDCNGVTDDIPPVPTTCGVGACASTGELACIGGFEVDSCVEGQGSQELCDNIDNDCDGTVDNGNPEGGAPCLTGQPGVCATGTNTCQSGSLVCVPDVTSSPEVCDNIDNDCDGIVDQGNPGGGGPCSTGLFGVCEPGTTTCVVGALQCVQNVQSSPEVCDNLDNDCNDSVDDNIATTPTTCGIGACASNGELACVNGVPTDTCTELPSTPEACDGIDNDCDGTIDNGNPGGGVACSTGLFGVCEPGTTTCVAGGIQCVQNVQPSPEVCDSLDNDCNGSVDDNIPTTPTTCGIGACASTGEITCVSGVPTDTCTELPSSPEVCDGIDNDCDGAVDQGNPGGGGACSTGLFGVCEPGTATCQNGSLQCVQNVQSSPEVCDNLDNDCNDSVDDNIATTPTTCGIGACASTGELACVNGVPTDTCTELPSTPEACDNLDNDCNGSVDDGLAPVPTQCGLGACASNGEITCVNGAQVDSCTAGQPSAELCDNIDNDCDGTVDGFSTACGVGACASMGTCDAGVDSCQAGTGTAEVCDAIDNDCDGVVDQGNPDGGTACTTTQPGVCAAGTEVCISGALACVPDIQSSPEVCDSLDNDCNGTTDDGIQPQPTTCGVGACSSTGEMTCVNGVPTDSCQEGQPSAETCDSIDNDCDGTADDGIQPQPTTCGVGACASSGEIACVNGALVDSCVEGQPTAELCDNLDNDCDGTVDSFSTACGVGACASTGNCDAGVDSCQAGTGTAEVCDAIDNDCDGGVDELNPGGGNTCTTTLPGVCAAGTDVCLGGALVCVPDVQPSIEVCDNLDNDCDGTADDGNPGGGAACATAQPGVCATGTQICQGGALVCTQDVQASPEVCDGLDNDCNNSVDDNIASVPTACGVGACAATGEITCVNGTPVDSCVVGQPTAEVCDGLDNDCDGASDEGNPGGGGQCVSSQPGVCAPGTEACLGGSLVCVPNVFPSTEICDNLDNDCDGSTDEGNPGGGGSCSTGQPGVCDLGTAICQNGALACMQTVQPASEICDGLDNDCDGTTDDGNPGGGAACATGLLGACSAGTTACQSGSLTCLQNVQSSPEVCNGTDDDCDGVSDNGDPGGGAACSTGLPGICAAGVTACFAGSVTCIQSVPSSPETCNNADDDCDGTIDDGLGTTTCGTGVCQVTVQNCVAGVPQTCTPGTSSAEICNGIDDDCDGTADEGNPGGGAACSTGVPGICSAGTTTCSGGGLTCVQNTSPAGETCNGIDDDCDGTADDGNPGGGVACSTGLPGICSAGTTTCSGGGLSCVQNTPSGAELCDGVDNDCDGSVDDGFGTTTCGTGACQVTVQNCLAGVPQTCTPGAPSAETCNGFDDDCDGTVDDALGSTTCGTGACQVTVQNCVAGVSQTCTPGAASAETCNGIDDDCDGTSDDGNPGGGVACTSNLPGVCTAGTTSCQAGGLTCVPNISPGTEVCNGLDDDCDGTVDDAQGGCTIFVTDPLSGDTLDCRTGATPPTITWDPAQYDKYKVFISWDPNFPGTKSVSSGETLLKVTSWTVPQKKWKNACSHAQATLYIRVQGTDVDVPKSDPAKKVFSPTVTVSVQH